MRCCWLMGVALVLGCAPDAHPVTERFVIVNDRPTSVFLSAKCGDPDLTILREAQPGKFEAVRAFAPGCGLCRCDMACDCPACSECTNAPLQAQPGSETRVIWSGEEFTTGKDGRCRKRCLLGAEVRPARYRVRLCASPFGFDSGEVVAGRRHLGCVVRDFDPFSETDVYLSLTGGATPCTSDDACGEGELCTVSTSIRGEDDTLTSGLDGEALCRMRCDPHDQRCGKGEACLPVTLLRDETEVVENVCLPI